MARKRERERREGEDDGAGKICRCEVRSSNAYRSLRKNVEAW